LVGLLDLIAIQAVVVVPGLLTGFACSANRTTAFPPEWIRWTIAADL